MRRDDAAASFNGDERASMSAALSQSARRHQWGAPLHMQLEEVNQRPRAFPPAGVAVPRSAPPNLHEDDDATQVTTPTHTRQRSNWGKGGQTSISAQSTQGNGERCAVPAM